MLKFIEQGLIALCFVCIWQHGYRKGKADAYAKATEAVKGLKDMVDKMGTRDKEKQ